MRTILLVTVLLVAIAACGGSHKGASFAALRTACEPSHYWDGTQCKPRGDAVARLAASKEALKAQDVEKAKVALDAAERGGPLDHESNVTLWEHRGIVAGFEEDQARATAAFEMLLALDPSHTLSYKLAPQVTFVFENVHNAQAHGAPTIDVNWPAGQRVGEPVPLEVQVVADPKQFLKRATIYVRARGETWRAADVALGRDTRVVLPPVRATQPTSVELYLRAYDDRGNEVLAWADPARPREIPLRYDPPPSFFRNWKTYVVGLPIVGVISGVIVYAVTREPPSEVGGSGGIGKK